MAGPAGRVEDRAQPGPDLEQAGHLLGAWCPQAGSAPVESAAPYRAAAGQRSQQPTAAPTEGRWLSSVGIGPPSEGGLPGPVRWCLARSTKPGPGMTAARRGTHRRRASGLVPAVQTRKPEVHVRSTAANGHPGRGSVGRAGGLETGRLEPSGGGSTFPSGLEGRGARPAPAPGAAMCRSAASRSDLTPLFSPDPRPLSMRSGRREVYIL
jgi:hypothetical protein